MHSIVYYIYNIKTNRRSKLREKIEKHTQYHFLGKPPPQFFSE
jgi:hypothetical protein